LELRCLSYAKLETAAVATHGQILGLATRKSRIADKLRQPDRRAAARNTPTHPAGRGK
jgi:hypothetical protein